MNDHRLAIRYKITGNNYKIDFTPDVCGDDCEEQTYTITPVPLNSEGYKFHPSQIFTYGSGGPQTFIESSESTSTDRYISEILGF